MKFYLPFLIGMFTSFLAISQIQYGIKAGLNITNLNVTGQNVTSSVKTRENFNAGIFADIHLSKSFFIQPEVVYSGQGGNLKDSSGNVTYNYINVPVLIKFEHSTGFFVESGPQVGFLIYSWYNTNSYSTDLKSQTNSTDFAWVFGLGYKIPSANFGFDFRYNLGLTNINNYSIITSKNSVFQLDLFYLFK